MSQQKSRITQTERGISHHLLLPIVAILAVGAIGAYLTFASKAATPPLVRTTADFIDSLGVVTHPSEPPYSLRTADQLVGDVNYLGVKHVRANPDPTPAMVTTLKRLQASGIKVDFTVASPNANPLEKYDEKTNEKLNFIRDNNLYSLTDFVENFNELDSTGEGNYPDTFQDILKVSVPYLWNQSSDLRAKNIKVLAPSLVAHLLDTDAAKLGKNISNTHFDYGNVHQYFDGSKPESAFPDALPNTANFNINPGTVESSNMDSRLKYYAYYVSKNKPMLITEFQYTPRWQKAQYYRMNSIYMPRGLLETFRIGITRTYMYQLYDDQLVLKGGGFGVMGDNTTGFERKPVANAVHNLTTLLGGGASGFSATNPQLAFTGDTSNLKSVILQKNAKEHWIALWRNVSAFNTVTGQGITVNPTNVTVTWQTDRTATFYSGLKDGPSPVQQSKGTVRATTVPVGAEVVLLKLNS